MHCAPFPVPDSIPAPRRERDQRCEDDQSGVGTRVTDFVFHLTYPYAGDREMD